MCPILFAGVFVLSALGAQESNPLLILNPPGNQEPITTVDQWEQKRSAIRAILDDFLGPFPKKVCPLDAKVEGEEDMGPYRRIRVTYNTLPTERVPAYLLIPKEIQGTAPSVVALHQTVPEGKGEVVGLTGNKSMSIGLHLVERGYVVLAPDGITAGERIGQGLEAFDTKEIYKKYPDWNALGIMVWESMRAVDYLCTRPECDREHIGVIGHSHGGYGSVYLAAYDSRIRCAVSSCGVLPIRDDPNPFRWAREEWFVFVPRLRPFLKDGKIPFDFDEVISLIAPRPFLNCSAYNDEIFPNSKSVVPCMDRVREVYEKIYNAGNCVDNIMHNSGHGFPDPVRQRAYEWMDFHLKGDTRK